MTNIIRVPNENNHFQRFEVLKKNRTKRFQYKEFFVEGVRNINTAIENKWEIKAFLYSSQTPLSDWGEQVLAKTPTALRYILDRQLMKKLSDKEDTSELIAIVTMPEDDINRIGVQKDLLVVVFDRPSNRGNLGSIIRSCDAFGCHGLIVTGHAVDLYDPETIRASMGSFFSIPIIRMPSPKDLQNWACSLKGTLPEIQVVGTSAKGSQELYYFDFSKPTILLIGNETNGLSSRFKQMSDKLVHIPISGSASSLNVASAASILLYEMCRQRNLGY